MIEQFHVADQGQADELVEPGMGGEQGGATGQLERSQRGFRSDGGGQERVILLGRGDDEALLGAKLGFAGRGAGRLDEKPKRAVRLVLQPEQIVGGDAQLRGRQQMRTWRARVDLHRLAGRIDDAREGGRVAATVLRQKDLARGGGGGQLEAIARFQGGGGDQGRGASHACGSRGKMRFAATRG